MAAQSFVMSGFVGSYAIITYDDVSLEILSVKVVNNSPSYIVAKIVKLDPPKRNIERTWQSGEETEYDVSSVGAHFDIDPIDGNLTMTNLELYVRYG